MKAALTWVSVFTIAAGAWLACMENILKHPGHGQRTAIAACVALQGLATLLFLLLDGHSILRVLVSIGALALAIHASRIARVVRGLISGSTSYTVGRAVWG